MAGIFITTATGKALEDQISLMDKLTNEWTMRAARGECAWICSDCCVTFPDGMPDACAHDIQQCTSIITRDKINARKQGAQAMTTNTNAAMFHSGEEIEGHDGLAMMVDMSVWNDALDAFDEISGDEMEPAQPQASLPTVEQVEASMGMGHGAWDMVDPNELIKAIVTLAADPKAEPAAQGGEEDAARLDWLEANAQTTIERLRCIGSGKRVYEVVASNDAEIYGEGDTLRAAIDAARAAKEGEHDGPL